MRRTLTLTCLTAMIALAPTIAHAQESVADALFREGQDLLREGKVELACAKLAESHRIDPALGTLINLALCLEKSGKTASAWTTFVEAAAQASRLGQRDRETFARQHASTLEPQVFFVVIEVPAPVDGLEVKLDGNLLGKGAWGSALPLDPGEHTISASRPGKRAWKATLTASGAKREHVAVPKLEDPQDETSRDTPRETPHEATRSSDTTRTVGWVSLGVGVVGIGLGAIFGVVALGKKSDVDNLCTGASCAPGGAAAADDARSSALISTVGFGVGIAAAGVGTVLLLTSKRGAALRVSPTASGLRFDGAF